MERINGVQQEIFPLNLGANPFGWTADQDRSFAILDAFREEGGNFIDTADVYSQWADGNSGGESETILGNWFAARGNRDRVVLATKCSSLAPHTGLSQAAVNGAVEDSLRRLQTDYIDLFYAHHDDPDTPVEDQVRTFDALVKAGTIRAIGLSNFTPARITEWIETADRLGATRPAAIQPQYNLVTRKEYEQELRPVVEKHDLAVFSYFSLASGFLTGKYRTEADLEGQARAAMAKPYFTSDGLRVVEALDIIAQARGVEISTVALAWLRAKGVTAPIASASRPEQLPALMVSVNLDLTDTEVATLDEVSAPFA